MERRKSIGVSGTGFIARGIAQMVARLPGYVLKGVLTRRPFSDLGDTFPLEVLTQSVDKLVASCQIIIECSGDSEQAARVLLAAGQAGRQAITINSEAQVTVVSALVQRGYAITEAHGDQPGCLADLDEEARLMGFRPLAYLNMKGFLNLTPTPEDMAYWAQRQGLSLRQVTSFTDGSKLQIEQALVANGLGARLLRPGMLGPEINDITELGPLAEQARATGQPVSDYMLLKGGAPGVAILADNPVADLVPGYLPFARLKMKTDDAYLVLRPHHLVHLEIGRTLQRLAQRQGALLHNSTAPHVTVVAVAKRDLPAGHVVTTGLGGFDLRGEAVALADCPNAVPITLTDGAVVRNSVVAGQPLTFADLDLPETLALTLYKEGVLGTVRKYVAA